MPWKLVIYKDILLNWRRTRSIYTLPCYYYTGAKRESLLLSKGIITCCIFFSWAFFFFLEKHTSTRHLSLSFFSFPCAFFTLRHLTTILLQRIVILPCLVFIFFCIACIQRKNLWKVKFTTLFIFHAMMRWSGLAYVRVTYKNEGHMDADIKILHRHS